MATVSIEEAQENLPDLIQQLSPGEELVITENGAPVARVVSVISNVADRKLGTMRGTVLNVADDFDDPVDEFQEPDFEPLYRQGANLYYSGQYDDAIARLKESYRIHPNAQSLRTIGECYMGLGQTKEAVLYFSASIGLRFNPMASYLLAQALVECDAPTEALAAVQKAIDELPHYKRAVKLRDELRKIVHPYSWPRENPRKGTTS